MDAHQIEYLDTLMHILPEANGKDVRNKIEVSFDEGDDLRHHTFVKLVEMGYLREAEDAKKTPLYDISFDEPKSTKFNTPHHNPERYLGGGMTLQNVVDDEVEDIVDGGWVDNGIGHYEYGGCPGYHTQVDYEYSINEGAVEWFEHFADLMTDKELSEHLAGIEEEGASVSINEGKETVYLTVSNVKAISITPVNKSYRGEVDGEWRTLETRTLYRYWFSATVGE